VLFDDIVRVFQSGIVTKHYKDIQNQNLMNATNQFTREALELKVEEVVTRYLNEGKMAFVESMHEGEGKKQFPFDSILSEEEYNPTKYIYSRILKVPGESPTFEQICVKYETVIKEKHPVLDYLLKNTISFKQLMSFNTVIKTCNTLWNMVNSNFTRGYCKTYKVSTFMEQMCRDRQVNAKLLIQSWKAVSKELGPIQV
jgi:hypothetical protein